MPSPERNSLITFSNVPWAIPLSAAIVAGLTGLLLSYYGRLWVAAYFCSADVTAFSLIRMSLRRVRPDMIVNAKIMGRQAGINTDRESGMSTSHLEAHALAGGDVTRVVKALIAAHQAGIALDFDRAAAIDLAGRDILDAVQTSVSPKVINCPESIGSQWAMVSAVARDGVELLVHARVTVRTNLDQLIGGATEATIVARVCHGIVAAIGSATSHRIVLESPERITQVVLERRLDIDTAFEIVSIDIADIDVGQNIGARLQSCQADSDIRVAQALAESRLAEAMALQQEMKVKVAEQRAKLVLAEANLPTAIARAYRAGQLDTPPMSKLTRRPALATAAPLTYTS